MIRSLRLRTLRLRLSAVFVERRWTAKMIRSLRLRLSAVFVERRWTAHRQSVKSHLFL